jgi:hypothetical protein
MDEPTKAKIRKRARFLYWVAELILILLVVAAVLIDRVWRTLEACEIFLDRQLRLVSTQVSGEFSRFRSGWAEELIAYPPPENAQDREAWAQEIIADFGQPAAVFVRDCCGLSWIARPPEMTPGIERLERVLARGVEKPDVVTCHTVGRMVTLRIGTLTDTTGTPVIMVGPENDSLRWGVVTHYKDALRAFFKRLNDPPTVVGMRHPAFTLQRVILLPANPLEDGPRLRASLNGEVLFESPRLDTTSHRYVFEYKGLREEFYATRQAETQALLIARPFLSWKFFAAVALIMLVIHVCWRWIKKLTAPIA